MDRPEPPTRSAPRQLPGQLGRVRCIKGPSPLLLPCVDPGRPELIDGEVPRFPPVRGIDWTARRVWRRMWLWLCESFTLVGSSIS